MLVFNMKNVHNVLGSFKIDTVDSWKISTLYNNKTSGTKWTCILIMLRGGACMFSTPECPASPALFMSRLLPLSQSHTRAGHDSASNPLIWPSGQICTKYKCITISIILRIYKILYNYQGKLYISINKKINELMNKNMDHPIACNLIFNMFE